MDHNTARLRAHLRNIERYEHLLKTKLNEIEAKYLEMRLAEERVAMAALQIMSSPIGVSKGRNLPEVPQ